jgi:hypothetical protein
LRWAGRLAAAAAPKALEQWELPESRSGEEAPAGTEWESPEQSLPASPHLERLRASEPAAVSVKRELAGWPVKPQPSWAAELTEFLAAVLPVRAPEAAVQLSRLEPGGDEAPDLSEVAVLEQACWPESKEPGGAAVLRAMALRVRPRNARDGPACLPVCWLRSQTWPELQARPEGAEAVARVFRGMELPGQGGSSLRQEAAVTVETAWPDVPGLRRLQALPQRQAQAGTRQVLKLAPAR